MLMLHTFPKLVILNKILSKIDYTNQPSIFILVSDRNSKPLHCGTLIKILKPL